MIKELHITGWDTASVDSSPLQAKLREELTTFLIGFKDRHPGTNFGITEPEPRSSTR
jgi:ATP-dependent phosphoenolpyruvate carboxykinase